MSNRIKGETVSVRSGVILILKIKVLVVLKHLTQLNEELAGGGWITEILAQFKQKNFGSQREQKNTFTSCGVWGQRGGIGIPRVPRLTEATITIPLLEVRAVTVGAAGIARSVRLRFLTGQMPFNYPIQDNL